MIQTIVFVLSLLAALLAVGLLRERRLRLALAMLLRRLMERWRNSDANHGNRDEHANRGGTRRV